MIPKKIHYCWFGRGEKPKLALKCIESWKKFCPDYEIIEWNEDNFDINIHPFIKTAYEAKKWAFSVDVIRLMVVNLNGGFYLDTDVELCSPIDDLLQYKSVFFWESLPYINLGLGFAAEKNNLYINALLESYNNKNFIIDKTIASPQPNTDTLLNRNLLIERNGNITQIIDNNYFGSMSDYGKKAHHLCMGSWIENKSNKKRNRTKIGLRFQKWLQDSQKIKTVEKVFGRLGLKVYVFLAYDLFDTGFLYFVKLLIKKLNIWRLSQEKSK